jgi:rod shape-determining protein MreC
MRFSSKKSKVLIWVVVVVLAIFLLNAFQKEVRSFFYWFSSPIQRTLWGAGERTSDFFGGIIKMRCLKEKLDEMNLKNQELLAQIVALIELKKENEFLRQALEIGLQKEFKLDSAQIISKDISQDFILIDKGSEDGISKNMPVITQQKVLVGKIGEIYKNFSKVILISNKESSFDAKISAVGGPAEGEQEKDISGVVKGQGNFRILFDLIPREENLSQEDIVVTSVLGGIFPKGLLVGKIKKIKKSDVEPFQQAEIEPFFDISQTDPLFIILEF